MAKIESLSKNDIVCDIFIPLVIIEAPLFDIYYNKELILEEVNSGTLVWRNQLMNRPHSIIKIQKFDVFADFVSKYSSEIDEILNDAVNSIIPSNKARFYHKKYDIR